MSGQSPGQEKRKRSTAVTAERMEGSSPRRKARIAGRRWLAIDRGDRKFRGTTMPEVPEGIR